MLVFATYAVTFPRQRPLKCPACDEFVIARQGRLDAKGDHFVHENPSTKCAQYVLTAD